ncbi:glycoside hydrolase family 16 protein [Thalassorhabdus alkalitolerans]|uniref:Glycoside hydrolase family 16 protein n=1 Tax=Thalassorhabdus alkalitolerans TaxID=2282697 RepID=A0ABW0YGA2_9BACI
MNKFTSCCVAVLAAALLCSEGKGMEAASLEKVNFSGYTWDVKHTGSEFTWGPGPNHWSRDHVNVDDEGRLHMKIDRQDNQWYSSEVSTTETLGYGTYSFQVDSSIDIDKNAVLGLFTYDMQSEDAVQAEHREIDIEFTKWGLESNHNSYYTVQPYIKEENQCMFTIREEAAEPTVHSFTWTPEEIVFRSATTGGRLLQTWTYSGEDIPDSQNEKVHINLWLFQGKGPSNNQPVEMVISDFSFTPIEENDQELKTSEENQAEEEPKAHPGQNRGSNGLKNGNGTFK